MVDKSKRFMKTRYLLETMPLLEGKRLYFDSLAEMITTRAQEIPDSIHVLFNDEVITYAQTNERSNKVANYLKEKGVGKGDVCSVMVLNSPEIYYTMFGIQKLGATAGAINYMNKGPEIAHVLNDSKPKVAFVSSGFMPEFERGYELASHKPLVIEVVQGEKSGRPIVSSVLSAIFDKYPADEALVPQALDDPCLLLYSSGTTGLPKGILLSNRNELSVCRNYARLGLNQQDDVMMIVAPMFHTNPICVWSYPYTYLGLTLCIRQAFSPADFWPSLAKYGVNVVWGTPAMYSFVMYEIDSSTIEYDKLELRYAFAGGAPLSMELIRDFKEKFDVQVVDGYGLTEGCGVGTSSVNAPLKPGTIGHPFFEQEMEIMDENNNILPYGTKGELCIKGEAVMLGYLNLPEATAETIRDGWLHTGDLAYMDESGYLFYAGRIKEMINRGGENIYPREVELPLEQHPKIKEVAVVGMPDPKVGERVKACIILKEPGSMTEAEVKEYLRDKIAKYKIPEIVQFYDVFPLSSSGKVLKREMK